MPKKIWRRTKTRVCLKRGASPHQLRKPKNNHTRLSCSESKASRLIGSRIWVPQHTSRPWVVRITITLLSRINYPGPTISQNMRASRHSNCRNSIKSWFKTIRHITLWMRWASIIVAVLDPLTLLVSIWGSPPQTLSRISSEKKTFWVAKSTGISSKTVEFSLENPVH